MPGCGKAIRMKYPMRLELICEGLLTITSPEEPYPKWLYQLGPNGSVYELFVLDRTVSEKKLFRNNLTKKYKSERTMKAIPEALGIK